MNYDIQFQKMQMISAIGWINIIETCDNNIANDISAKYFKKVREEAIEKYADAMSKLVGQALEISKVLIEG